MLSKHLGQARLGGSGLVNTTRVEELLGEIILLSTKS
jgi:hypothetical protein